MDAAAIVTLLYGADLAALSRPDAAAGCGPAATLDSMINKRCPGMGI
jgi:hypothetical protein